ncbi:MAG: helix-turn-helix domain-containing protein [bacterium]|nr:helix-turn-helix domain-containing protein [bacterium]
MDDEKYKEYLLVLELAENPSPDEIERSYTALKKLYSADSIVTQPMDEEFSQEDKQEILDDIEEAYQALIEYAVESPVITDEPLSPDEIPFPEEDVEEPPAPVEPPDSLPDDSEPFLMGEPVEVDVAPAPIELEDTIVEVAEEFEEEGKITEKELAEEEILEEEVADEEVVEVETEEPLPEAPVEPTPVEPTPVETTPRPSTPAPAASPRALPLEGVPIIGQTLKKLREKKGVGIHEIAVSTKISYKILVNIEQERFDRLPEGGYLRWHIMTYAKALALDPHKVADEYMKRYRKWAREQK